MQSINLPMLINSKLLESVSARVPVEIKDLVDDLAKSKGSNRGKWIREAIELKLEVELGKSSTQMIKNSMNTTYSGEYKGVFRNLLSFLYVNKKLDIAGRAFRIH